MSQKADFLGVNFGSSQSEIISAMKSMGHRKYAKNTLGVAYKNILFADKPSEIQFYIQDNSMNKGTSTVYGLGDDFINYFTGLRNSLMEKYGVPGQYLGLVDLIPSKTDYKLKDDRIPLHWMDPKEYILFWEQEGLRISLSYNGSKTVCITYTKLKSNILNPIKTDYIIDTSNL
ncbi:hypothetical protein ACFSQ3_12970 [Sphingobacterium corticis]|uniref:Uncharacterized protein n=1 Tax=Sphingobacterium corticis TaxID=1812823 RepID=A0ABW5NMJ6_9SPHI